MVEKGLKSCGLRCRNRQVIKEFKPLGPNKAKTPPERGIREAPTKHKSLSARWRRENWPCMAIHGLYEQIGA